MRISFLLKKMILTPEKKLKYQKGFTLVELLLVIVILGILTAIAIPMYLGHRDKARVATVEAGAARAVSEIQAALDAYITSDPYIVLDVTGAEICVQASLIVTTKKTCQAVYNLSNFDTYSTLDDVIQDIIDHYKGKKEASPFDRSQYLFVSSPGFSGTVVVEPSSVRSIRIRAFALDSSPVFETVVRAR